MTWRATRHAGRTRSAPTIAVTPSTRRRPIPAAGRILLQELNLVEAYSLAGRGPLNPASIHLMVEAKKLAFADREA